MTDKTFYALLITTSPIWLVVLIGIAIVWMVLYPFVPSLTMQDTKGTR